MPVSQTFYLGADLGSTKTHVLIADGAGRAVGLGAGGPGNHEIVGFDGMTAAIREAAGQALEQAGLSIEQIDGLGFGVSGYDWSCEEVPITQAIQKAIYSQSSFGLVNDAILGLLAGSSAGWGVAVVSGTGCNCWGWDKTRQKIGRVTGGSLSMGERAGASELMAEAQNAIAYEWTQRGPKTALSSVFVRQTGASSLEDLLEGIMFGKYQLDPCLAPLIFQTAEDGDAVALDLVRWAGSELGELVKAVVRQLKFEALDFEVVMTGSMFNGGKLLTSALESSIHELSPGARLIRLTTPPVVGAVLLSMEKAGQPVNAVIRTRLETSARAMQFLLQV